MTPDEWSALAPLILEWIIGFIVLMSVIAILLSTWMLCMIWFGEDGRQ